MGKACKIFLHVVLWLAGLLWLSSCSTSSVPPYLAKTMTATTIKDKAIGEASGVAISRRDDQLIWINNDSGNSADIFAVNRQGETVATVTIPDVDLEWLDWEDLASFELNGKPYLLIADVGDNFSSHWRYTLYFVPEPDLSQLPKGAHLELKPEWTMHFVYEDGPRDCESVAVDVKHRRILLLSKREDPPALYSLPLKNIKAATAKRLGQVPPFPQPSERHFRLVDLLGYTTMPTAMDIAADGSGLVVLTYGDAFYYSSDGIEDDWLKVLHGQPQTITLPALKQAEGIGFDQQGEHVFVTGERRPTPLLDIDISGLRK